MAELMIGPLVSMVKEKASNQLLNTYRVMEGMEEQRKILDRQLPAILGIIQHVEEKINSQGGVSIWLTDLKSVSYEASDVFDEFKYEALRREAQKKGLHRIKVLSSYPARNPIVFRYRMGKKLRKIVQTIQVLVTEMNKFEFRHIQRAPPSKQWRETDPIMVDSDKDIISRSRDEEKKKIMRMLLDEACSKDLTVLPIVGMGGLGKTTFVQLIYNDPAIQKHFELRRWCCVSHDFDAANIANNICQTNVNGNRGREKAFQDLQSLITGKRYLIVLDDVWDPDDDKWGKLKTCLNHGDKGSVVLTTTRNEKIARKMVMGVAEAYNIEKLSDEHLKEIIENRAFSSQKPNHCELDKIVDKIVDRCVGCPLAAKAMGCVLRDKVDVNDWNWKDILTKTNICTKERTEIWSILKLSFDDLPSYMKQCFAFCAIFPKDYDIDVEILIQLWMAHDFIPLQEDNHPKTTGAKIFKELAWRSFFQDVKPTSPIRYGERLQLRNRTMCKIHDLMHDIALDVAGKECATIVDGLSMKKILSNPTRHLYLSAYGKTLLDDTLKKQSSTLQTLFYKGNNSFDISKCTSLRALHLPSDPFLPRRWMAFPEQIHHLRYLNLAENKKLEQLPEVITIMYHLQTLNISHCPKLCQLPKDMKYMASLCHLYTNGCKSLTYMPPALGQITSLQTLTYFVVGANSSCSSIGELRNLNDLGGELELCCLENATEAHAKEANLGNKEKLTHLSLAWDDKGQEGLVQDCHKKVLYALKPHDGLQMLRIVNYKGTSFPTWITYLSNLTELHLTGCILCKEFPPFCHFKDLQALCLEKLDKLQSLCGDMTFLALKELQLHDLESLARWVATEGKEVMFPVLEKLDIKSCPKLTSLPEAPNLKDIKLDEGKAMLSLELVVKSRHYIPSLSILKLAISDREDVTRPQIDQDHESSLSELMLKGCNFFFSYNPTQPTFGAWKWFGKLASLEISDCHALKYWPEDVFESLVWLENLTISSCDKLIGCTPVRGGDPTQTTDQFLPHINMISIENCGILEELFILPQSLRYLDITGCPRLEFIWGKEEHRETDAIQLEYCRDLLSTSIQEQSPSPRNHHPCLEYLELSDCDNLEVLPNLPPSLRYLCIECCNKLCSLSGHLNLLDTLDIYGCGKLQSFDSLGDLPSLEVLTLESCQCLTSLPGVLGSYSALQTLTVKYCQSIDLTPLYKRHQQRLNSLELKDISHANSSNPYEGPKLREPRSWKYAIPGVADWTERHRRPHWI